MNWYKLAQLDYNSVWLNKPDEFEADGVPWHIETIPISKITGIGWTVTKIRKEIENMFKNGNKLPLILVEKLNNKNDYELHDGQHRFAAYRNVFPQTHIIKAAVFEKPKRSE